MTRGKESHLEPTSNYSKEILRLTTAGNSASGKSTLINRLFTDIKSLEPDRLNILEAENKIRNNKKTKPELSVDEYDYRVQQGNTIESKYGYFITNKRKYGIADIPGQLNHTRELVNESSNADLAIILIDARNGIPTQSKRHSTIISLFGIQHLIVAINKMDLVEYDEKKFNTIIQEYSDFSEKLNIRDITYIPVSALNGDNIVSKSRHMHWYEGPTIFQRLESITIAADSNLVDFRFPVQEVIWPREDSPSYSGKVVSGTIVQGEEIIILPSREESKISAVIHPDGSSKEAYPKQFIKLTLENKLNIKKGDMIVRKRNLPDSGTQFDAMIFWMDNTAGLKTTTSYILKHLSKEVKAIVRNIEYKLDLDTLHRKQTEDLQMNEIARVSVETSKPIHFDSYEKNRETGNFALVDPVSKQTVAAGIIRGVTQNEKLGFTIPKSKNIFRQDSKINQEERESRNGHKAHILWFTGLSGAGKSTVARELERILFNEGKHVYLLDGDNIRSGLNSDLSFSVTDRQENIRRIGHVARLMFDMGSVVICAFISPNTNMRDYVRGLFPENGFSEIYIDCSVEVCRERDVKGLYKKAYAGEILNFTGVSAVYEKPANPELKLNTAVEDIAESVDKVLKYVKGKI